jgi:hypothetical protein
MRGFGDAYPSPVVFDYGTGLRIQARQVGETVDMTEEVAA